MPIADLILVLHAVVVVLVVGGQALFMAGYHRRWRWVLHRSPRMVHLGLVLFITLQAWAGRWCPLTLLEYQYRAAAGEPVPTESFLQHWLGRLVYWDVPPRVCTAVYTLFGLLVLGYFLLLERRNRDTLRPSDAP
ncbi:MAG: DUF2784 domain-containing protein [Thermodesulfobacteriota bacterium]